MATCTSSLVSPGKKHLINNDRLQIKTKAYNIRCSQAVSDPSTNQTRRCLTWQIGRDAVLTTFCDFVQSVTYRLNAWYRQPDWLTDWYRLTDWLIDWLLTDWHDWLIQPDWCRLTDWLIDWLTTDWLTDMTDSHSLTDADDWQPDWLTDWKRTVIIYTEREADRNFKQGT